MNIAELSTQWPALALLLALCAFLLKLVQSQYLDQIRDLRADRDAWREIAERGSWLAQQGLHQAERSQSPSPSLPVKTP
jgi:hypothetical protein